MVEYYILLTRKKVVRILLNKARDIYTINEYLIKMLSKKGQEKYTLKGYGGVDNMEE